MTERVNSEREAESIGHFIRISVKVILIVALILISFTLINSIIRVSGSLQDIEYSFSSYGLYDGNNTVDYRQSWNIQNQTCYTNVYNATYSFTDDADGDTGYDIDFIDYYTAGGSSSASIVANEDKHSKVLYIDDNDAGTSVVVENTISAQDTGAIEFWVKGDGGTFVIIPRGVGELIQLNMDIDEGKWHIQDFTGWQSHLGSCAVGIWSHVRIELNNSGNYYKVFINGTLISDGTPQVQQDIQELNFWTNSPETQEYYIDAIGYSWDSYYDKYDNVIPLKEENYSIQEIDKLEFALEGINDLVDFSDSDVSGFIATETGGDTVRTSSDGSNDRRYRLETYDGESGEIERDDFNYHSDRIHIQFKTYFNSKDYGIGTENRWEIYSYDDTKIVELYDINDDFGYYDTDGLSAIAIRDGLPTGSWIYIDLEIDYHVDLCRLELSGGVSQVEIFPLIDPDKEGLNSIHLKQDASAGDSVDMYLDWVEVDSNSTSLGDEYGYRVVYLNQDWDYQEHSLVSVNGNGTLSFNGVSGSGTGYLYNVEDTFREIMNHVDIYNGTERVINIYDGYSGTITNASLVIYMNNTHWIDNVAIEGVYLVRGSNYYPMTLYHKGIDIQENYFYVDNERLYYSHTSNDGDLELIQASFSFSPIQCFNRSMRFISNQNSTMLSHLIVEYTDNTNSEYDILGFYQTVSSPLESETSLNNFTIQIYDNDTLGNYTTEGFIYRITLVYNPFNILDYYFVELLDVMIPLLIVLPITLLLGKRLGRVGYVLGLILITTILVMNLIIPAWILFIVVLSSIIFFGYDLQRRRA